MRHLAHGDEVERKAERTRDSDSDYDPTPGKSDHHRLIVDPLVEGAREHSPGVLAVAEHKRFSEPDGARHGSQLARTMSVEHSDR